MPPTRSVEFNGQAFVAAIDAQRLARNAMSYKAVGIAAGVPGLTSMVGHIRHGGAPSIDNLVKLLAWLGTTDLKPYIRPQRGVQP